MLRLAVDRIEHRAQRRIAQAGQQAAAAAAHPVELMAQPLQQQHLHQPRQHGRVRAALAFGFFDDEGQRGAHRGRQIAPRQHQSVRQCVEQRIQPGFAEIHRHIEGLHRLVAHRHQPMAGGGRQPDQHRLQPLLARQALGILAIALDLHRTAQQQMQTARIGQHPRPLGQIQGGQRPGAQRKTGQERCQTIVQSHFSWG